MNPSNESERLIGLFDALDLPVESGPGSISLSPDDPDWPADALAALKVPSDLYSIETDPEPLLRITRSGTPGEQRCLARAVQTIFAPDALLFDLDGVLADVSGSYRRAIRETAAAFGVDVTPEEISSAKMAGDANNDWVLTKRLIESEGNTVDLDDVIDVFERKYHGTDEESGLHEHESLLVDRSWVEGLSDAWSLGIVTGRPRRDAERFLSNHGIDRFVQCLVTMDDVERLKPDPEPVRAGLSELDAEAGWYVGDTPDDMEAARKAGVLPVGVVPPEETMEHVKRPLERAGAARVLRELEELIDLLPE